MESTGEEKQIRALFSELKFADELTAPSFTAVWHRAQSRSLQPRRAFNFAFVAATALLVCALAGLALWSRSWQSNNPPVVAIVNPAIVPYVGPVPVAPTPSQVETTGPRSNPVKKRPI